LYAQCARGPTYWCQNVKTASLCGAVTHCQQNVWNKPQMKTVPCDLCKEVLIVVEQILKDNATEAEVLGYLEKACQLIPDQGLTAECKEMVDAYYPILMGILKGELEDPIVVCGAIGLCQSQQAALAKAHAQEQLVSNEIPLVDLAQQVSPFLLNVPELLYPQESQKSPKQESPKQENADVCVDCVKFLTDAQAEAKANTSFVNSLIENFENQCDFLGPSLADMCKQYVSQYGSLVIDQLMSMEPKDLCIHAGFCTATKKSIPMLKLLAAKAVPALKLFPATKVGSAKVIRLGSSVKLIHCLFQEEVVHAVEKVCTYLPSSLSAQCKDLIETYGQAIIELLVQQPNMYIWIITDFGSKFSPAALDQTVFKTGGYCPVCKMVVNYIDRILEKNATEEQIEEAVRKVCSFLDDSFQTECDQMIQQYEPMLIQLLLQMLDPDFVCMKMGACPEAVRRLLGTEQCSWGPAFWCKNMETASRCNAVAHCKRHVWA
uniref:Prosaposin n=1 Tax=Cyclopterus lumpus TaxID=8103 RepID=A0A8C2XC95_CYCLU